MSQELMALLIGAVFIVTHTYERYNKPATNRISTTAFRYHVSAFIYCSLYLFVFYIFSKYPKLLDVFQITEIGGSPELFNAFQGLPPAFVAALVFTILIERIPILKNSDEKLRAFLQQAASIPFEALRLTRQLIQAEFVFSAKTKKEVSQALSDWDMMEHEIKFVDGDDEAMVLLSKITALKVQLDGWEKLGTLGKFIYSNRQEYDSNTNRFARLVKKAKTCVELSQMKSGESDAESSKLAIRAAKECHTNLLEQCRSLFASQCEFIARAVLKCNVTQGSRDNLLGELGFKVTKTTPDVSLNNITTLIVMLLTVVAVILVVTSDYVSDIKRSALISVMVGIMFTVSTASVVYTKGKWAISSRDVSGHLPMTYYLSVGALAVVLSLPVTVLFKLFFFNGGAGYTLMEYVTINWYEFLYKTWPWKLLIFANAAWLAYLLDTSLAKNLPENKRRLAEAFMHSIFIAGVTVFVLWILVNFGMRVSRDGDWIAVLRNASIGFVIGYYIPFWYRQSLQGNRRVADFKAQYIEGV